jgi:hypothetical protein
MPRAKPSTWQPKGLEVFDTCDLYSDDDLVKLIIHHLGTHRKKTRKILVQLRNVTGLLRAGLHFRKRPTHGEKEGSLRIVASATRELLLALEAMDADTRRLLESKADQCPDEVDIVIKRHGFHIPSNTFSMHGIVGDLAKWTVDETRYCNPSLRPVRGRRSQAARLAHRRPRTRRVYQFAARTP